MSIIKIKVIDLKESDPSPYVMTIGDHMDIKAYMYRDPTLLFHYKGSIYKAYDINEKQFLDTCPQFRESKINF